MGVLLNSVSQRLAVNPDTGQRIQPGTYNTPQQSDLPYGYRMPQVGSTPIYHGGVVTGYVPNSAPDAPTCPPGHTLDPITNACVPVQQNVVRPDGGAPTQPGTNTSSYPIGRRTGQTIKVGDETYDILNTDFGDQQVTGDGRMGYGGNYIIDKEGQIIASIQDGIISITPGTSSTGKLSTLLGGVLSGPIGLLTGAIKNRSSWTGKEGDDNPINVQATTYGDTGQGATSAYLRHGGVDINGDGQVDDADNIFVAERESQTANSGMVTPNEDGTWSWEGNTYNTIDDAVNAKNKYDATAGAGKGAAKNQSWSDRLGGLFSSSKGNASTGAGLFGGLKLGVDRGDPVAGRPGYYYDRNTGVGMNQQGWATGQGAAAHYAGIEDWNKVRIAGNESGWSGGFLNEGAYNQLSAQGKKNYQKFVDKYNELNNTNVTGGIPGVVNTVGSNNSGNGTGPDVPGFVRNPDNPHEQVGTVPGQGSVFTTPAPGGGYVIHSNTPPPAAPAPPPPTPAPPPQNDDDDDDGPGGGGNSYSVGGSNVSQDVRDANAAAGGYTGGGRHGGF